MGRKGQGDGKTAASEKRELKKIISTEDDENESNRNKEQAIIVTNESID